MRPLACRPPCISSSTGWASTVSLLALLLLALQGLQSDAACGPGLSTPGVTIPHGDIVLQEGDLLELYCVLNLTHSATKGRNASHLTFYQKSKKISRDYLQVLNETTLKLSMRPKVSDSMYYCRLEELGDAKEEAVCLNNVAVGYPPQEVTDFSCVSQNWQNLTCSWKKKYNPVKTTYTIWYRLSGRAGGRSKYGCPEETDVKLDKCVWNETSNPHYRQPYEFYSFYIEGVNRFNKSISHKKFHHYAHVIPAKPENLRVKEKTAYSAFIEWSVPYPMQNFPPGLVQRVEYLPQWGPRDSWFSVNTSVLNQKQHKHELNITSLKYANTVYDIRVYMKSAKANFNDDTLWSAPAIQIVKTKPDLPAAPPRMDIGSFEVNNHVNSRDIYIYWQTIPEYLQNGDNFSYKIIEIEENGRLVMKEVAEMKKKHAKFSKVDLNKNLRIRLASVNSEGQSVNKSEISIPGRHQVPPGPLSVTKVFYENGTYELSWNPPTTNQENIESYTIFWCDSKYDHACSENSGYFNWTHVPSNITIQNMTVEGDQPYEFAVSANTRNASSGMVWASCTILHNKPIQKMKNVWVKKVGSTFMELVWSLDCLDRNGLVEGFRIYYCPVQHQSFECKSPNQNVTVQLSSTFNLTGLRPYTTYSVAIAVLSKGAESLPSEPLYNVTLEAAPSTPPQNVSIVSITNTTITITWNAPEDRNGAITKYEVYYDKKVQTKNMDPNVDVHKKQELTLEKLNSHYNYSISVAACTVACSDKSPPLTAETKVGEPGEVNTPHVKFLNSSQLLVTWDPPARASGFLDYYEVQIIHPGEDNSTAKVVVTTNTSLLVWIEECSEEQNQPYSFSVRAVNKDPYTNQEFKGQWSSGQDGSYSCGIPQRMLILIYILSCGGGVVFLLFICGFCGRRAWTRCQKMRDFQVKLPPGLERPQVPERDQDFKMHQWETHNLDSKPPHDIFPAADEERLLQQKDDRHERNLSGDSSGCSSGHESVSSSATSGTHISADSGTEVDRNEPGYGDPSWEEGSKSDALRQRQVVNRPPWDGTYTCVGGKGVRSTPNLTELEPGYTVLSLASWPSASSIPDRTDKPHLSPSPQQAKTDYVSLDAATALSPRVIPPLDLNKQGYVSHPTSTHIWSQRDPDKGYVKTGIKEAFTPECDGNWDEPFRAELQRLQPNSGGYVKAGECGIRPSRTEPSLSSGYVMTGENVILRDRHKPDPLSLPQTSELFKQAHEYVSTGDRQVHRNPPLLMLDPDPDPVKGYCRVSERETPLVRPILASSGYVPHIQLEAHNSASIVE